MEDNIEKQNIIYSDPNAYIQHFEKPEKKHATKVVFSEPYECAPHHYIDHGFKKEKCDCVPTKKDDNCHHHNHNCKCGCEKEKKPKQSPFSGFDFKSFLPLLTGMGGGGNKDLGKIMSMLGGTKEGSGQSDGLASLLGGGGLGNILSMLGGSGGGLGGLMNMFGGGKKEAKKQTLNQSDYPIKEYTRVE